MPTGSLFLNSNKLTGQVPSELGSLSRLSTSDMRYHASFVFLFWALTDPIKFYFVCRHCTNGLEQLDWRCADRRLRGLFQYLSNVLCWLFGNRLLLLHLLLYGRSRVYVWACWNDERVLVLNDKNKVTLGNTGSESIVFRWRWACLPESLTMALVFVKHMLSEETGNWIRRFLQ
jgi:hypothetical protein